MDKFRGAPGSSMNHFVHVGIREGRWRRLNITDVLDLSHEPVFTVLYTILYEGLAQPTGSVLIETDLLIAICRVSLNMSRTARLSPVRYSSA